MSEEERKMYKKQEECLLKAATKDEDPIKFKHVRSMLEGVITSCETLASSDIGGDYL